MDAFMDNLWNVIMNLSQNFASLLNQFLTPLHVLGPLFVIGLLAFFTVCVTKILNRVIVTKRYLELEKEFQHWFSVREEALKNDSGEKGRRLAKNIDQAKLNKTYYDYFLEGFLLGLLRNVLPIILMVMYINEYYRAEELQRLFGRPYVLSFSFSGNEPLLMGAVFTYLLSLLLLYLSWYVVKKSFQAGINNRLQNTEAGTAANELQNNHCCVFKS